MILLNPWERIIWDEVYRDMVDDSEYAKRFNGVRARSLALPMLRDAWGAGFQPSPHYEAVVDPTDELASLITRTTQKLVDSPGFGGLHRHTRLDDWLSLLLAHDYVTEVLRSIEDLGLDEMQDLYEAEDELDESERQRDGARRGAGKPGEQGEQGEQEQAVQKAQQKVQQAAQAAAKAINERRRQNVHQITNASASIGKMQNALESLESMGLSAGDGDGQRLKVDPANALRLGQRLMQAPDLKKIANRCGQLRELAVNVMRKAMSGKSSEIMGVTTGMDLPKAMPSEVLGLRHPVTRPEVIRKWHDGQLLQYQNARRNNGYGPMLILIDRSGSTAEIQDWLKGVATGLLELARRQKRNAHVILFSGGPDLHHISFGARDRDHRGKILELAEVSSSGGTSWWPPMRKAAELIKQDRSLRDADVFLITDGDCYDFVHDPPITEEFNAERKRMGYRVTGILVNCDQSTAKLIAPGCDEVRFVDTTDEGASTVFELVKV